jgi:CrcB protein
MTSYLLVFLGAGIGGALRHGVNVGCARYCGVAFPWGTLTVNVAGSFIMGALAAWLALRAGEGWSQPLRLFLATGILGGFTTFSAFSLDAVLIWERGEAGHAAAYVAASVVLSIAGLVAGLALVRTVAG